MVLGSLGTGLGSSLAASMKDTERSVTVSWTGGGQVKDGNELASTEADRRLLLTGQKIRFGTWGL